MWEAHLDLVLINRKEMGEIQMVVDNLNENHHKVIEFMVLGKEGWQYQQDIRKKIDFNKLQKLLSTPLGTCSMQTGVQKIWKLQESLSKGLKPSWTVIPILKLC